MTLKLDGNREVLYQWDLNQRIILIDVAVGTKIHFFDAQSKSLQEDCLSVSAYEENGIIYANIPNIMLQKHGIIIVYIYIEQGDRAYTEHHAEIIVLARPKPSDYIYTETEVKRYEELEGRITLIAERIKELEENGGGGGAAVESVNGKIGAVELTADDVGALPSSGGKVSGSIQATGTLIAGRDMTYAARLAGAAGMAMMSAVDKSNNMVNNIQLSPSRTTLGQPLAVSSGGHGGKSAAEGRKNLDVYSKSETDSAISEAVAAIPATDLSNYYTKTETDTAIGEATAGEELVLIEKITLEEEMIIDRSAEPDGTPYTLKRMYLNIEATAPMDSGNVYAYCGDAAICMGYLAKKSDEAKQYFANEFKQEAGRWLSSYMGGWTANGNGVYPSNHNGRRWLTYSVKDKPHITRLKTPAISAGTIIEIWGVRADA